MIKGGKGGSNTTSGLKFEKRSSFKNLFNQIPNYKIIENNLYFKENKVATFYKKYDLYKKLLEPNNINYKNYISKRLLPDDTIYVLQNNTLFIIEMKFQQIAGSVDEKLQTCDFKNKQYNKLLSPLNINVKYVYLLSNWFKKDEYKDVLDYIKSVNCYYFFKKIPLDFLGLPK